MVVIARTLHLEHTPRSVRIDWGGATLLAAATSSLMVWLSVAGNPDFFAWFSWPSAVLLGITIVCLVAFILVERRVMEPVMDLRIFKNRTILMAIIASVSMGVLMMSLPAYLGLYFQNGRGLAPTESGLLTLPLILGSLVGTTVSGQLITRYGRWKIFLVVGSAMGVISTLWLAWGQPDAPFWLIGLQILFAGLGTGMVVQNVMLAVQNTVTVGEVGAASAAIAYFRTVGGAIGNSVMGSVMAIYLAAAVTPAALTAGYAAGGGPMFLAAALIAVPAVIAVSMIREVPLRRTI